MVAWGVAATIGITIALLIAGQAYGKQSNNSEAQRSNISNPQAAPTVIHTGRPAPYQSPTHCEHPESAEQENLCIARRASSAAEDQAYWARRNFWIGVAGTFFVVLTFLATAGATWAAQRSALAAEKAIEGGEAALAHAREATEWQLRAYVY